MVAPRHFWDPLSDAVAHLESLRQLIFWFPFPGVLCMAFHEPLSLKLYRLRLSRQRGWSNDEWKCIGLLQAQLFRSILNAIRRPLPLFRFISINTTVRYAWAAAVLCSTNMMDYTAPISTSRRHSSHRRLVPSRPVPSRRPFPWRRQQFSSKSGETGNKPDSL